MRDASPLPASVRIPALPTGPGVRAGTGKEQRPVSRLLFGKFTEHLGRNVYGGAWAQLIANPEFASPAAWPNRAELLRRLQTAGQDFHLPALPSALADDGAPWWVPEGDLKLGLEERRGRPVLRLLCPADAAARLITPLYLPVHRCISYRLQLLARADVPLTVELRDAARNTWASARLPPNSDWTACEVTLQGPAGPPPPAGTPFQLCLEPAAAGVVELRRCLLLPDDHLDGWDPDVVRFLQEAHLSLLRFPGGNFASAYHWRDGVGPVEDRPVRPNPAWPEAEWNHVGTDEWLRLCELVGCQALICVNAGDGSAEEAAEWVEYCNGAPSTPMGALRALHGHPRPYGVRLWEVGNELYGSWQVGATDAAGYAARYRRYAAAMLERDRDIHLIANGDNEAWNRTLVFTGGPHVRSLSHHCLYAGFPEDADPLRVYLEHMAFTPAYRQMWDELSAPLREAGQTPLLAITEQQVFTHRQQLPNNATLAEAIWDASILNEAIRADGLVELITHSALINHGAGLRKEREIVYAQPAWWVTHLYGSAPDPLYLLPVEVETPRFTARPYRLRTMPDAPYLDAVALTDQSGGTLVFFLVNRHPTSPLEVTFSMPGWAGTRAELDTLSGDSFMAGNTWHEPEAVQLVVEQRAWHAHESLVLPPCSLVRMRLW